MKVHSMWLGCGCLLMAATVSAVPTVSGTNEAISIVKTKVESTNGFQLLCVPVVKLDISGGATKGNITLAEMFPPASYPTNAAVTVLSSSNGDLLNQVFTVAEGQWKNGTTAADADATAFPAGTIFWLKNGSSNDTLFFGGMSGQTIAVPAEKGMRPNGNAASAAVQISAISGAAYDRLLVLKNGSNEYVTYLCEGATSWLKETEASGVWVAVADTDTIAAGEAFYYYNAAR